MKTIIQILAPVLLCLCTTVVNARACTTFVIKDKHENIFFGRNFDYLVGDAHVTVNQRNQKKTALIKAPEKPLTWVSKFGSITFNLTGKESPCGGMNEAGLVVEMMRLANTKYPEMDERSGLTVLQWIQYQLDNSKTVEDVIKSDATVRISKQSTTINHFLIADRNGNSAIIEYLDGAMKYYTGEDVKQPVLANSSYDDSLGYIKKFAGFGGSDALQAKDESSLGRFARAASLVQKYTGDTNIKDYSFRILDSVWQTEKKEWLTQWSIVYDIKNLNIHYRTSKNKEIRSVAFKDFDFGCAAKTLIIDIDKKMTGATDFYDYSTALHRDLIERVLNSVPSLKNISQERRDVLARYPQTITCSENK
jgi:choloylglycine hydrolase